MILQDYFESLLYRGAVLWRQIGQTLGDFQNTKLAREGLPSWCHLLLAHSGTKEPGQSVQNEFIIIFS